jgi:hypothetical protein
MSTYTQIDTNAYVCTIGYKCTFISAGGATTMSLLGHHGGPESAASAGGYISSVAPTSTSGQGSSR